MRYSVLPLLFTVLIAGPSTSLAAAPAQTQPACPGSDYRQFDFWVGDWDVFEVEGGSRVAGVRVDRVLDGCALRERYQDNNGMLGESLSIYDESRGLWHQSWFTNRGRYLSIDGRLDSGAMILAGSYKSSNGLDTLVRGTWKPVGNGVRETAVTSTDHGKSWQPWFDLMFRPRGPTTVADDAKAVAALDTQYQAAVKNNDAATMDRILAGDFVLVTGSGKTYNKSDLLTEARSGRVQYERQEDTEQKVRLWGDTAVVTAKLWEKGTDGGKTFDRTVWFSDTYVRTPAGWRYVFGQSSLPLPAR